MRIAILSPYSRGAVRGNLITVRRIASALERDGHSTVIFAMDTANDGEIEAGLDTFAPEVILGFHAYHCGESVCRHGRRLKVPCVVTITGSDIHEAHFREHPSMQSAMKSADAVVCFDESSSALVSRYFPLCTARVALIPQGSEVLPTGGPLDKRISESATVILLPAALRPVKNVELPLQVLGGLVTLIPGLQLVIAGGVIDREYADRILSVLADAPFALWLGEVPHDRMGALYARADIVLNCSRFEGMPNSLLEAMALGRPVVAADIPGNRSLIRDKETGWLYSGAVELGDKVLELVGNPELRDQLGKNGREFVRAHFSSRREAGRYIELFTTLGVVAPG